MKKNECKYYPILCKECLQQFPRLNEENHRSECPNRKLNCQWCNKEIKVSNLDIHLASCEEVLIECPMQTKGCNIKIPKKSVSQHLIGDCQFVDVPCVFLKYGCNFKAENRIQLADHMKDPLHIDLALKALIMYEEKEKQYLTKINEYEKKLEDQESKKISLSQVVAKIEEAIHGIPLIKLGGAALYDKGDKLGCYTLYLNTSQELVNIATNGKQENQFWAIILMKAIETSKNSTGYWGTQLDPAWILRKGFEAIKLGARYRGENLKPDLFWERIKDTHNFISLAQL